MTARAAGGWLGDGPVRACGRTVWMSGRGLSSGFAWPLQRGWSGFQCRHWSRFGCRLTPLQPPAGPGRAGACVRSALAWLGACSHRRQASQARIYHGGTEAQRRALVRIVRCLGGRRYGGRQVRATQCLCAYYENTPRVGTLAGAASTYYAAFAVIWTSYPMARSRFVRLMAVR